MRTRQVIGCSLLLIAVIGLNPELVVVMNTVTIPSCIETMYRFVG